MTAKEKDLTIQLLTEKIERISGKKVKFLKEEKEKEEVSKEEIKEIVEKAQELYGTLNEYSTQLKKDLKELKDGTSPYVKDKEDLDDFEKWVEKFSKVIEKFEKDMF